MKDIKLNLSVSEVNLILKSLGNLPYVQVAPLIEKIQAQANPQVTHLNGNGHEPELNSEVIANHS
jgi:hypothetical protein